MIISEWVYKVLEELATIVGDVSRASIMSGLLIQLHEDSFFDNVYCEIIVSLDFALILNYYNSPRSVHVQWEDGDAYNVFLDHCGSGDKDFYGQWTSVSSATLVQTIKDYLLRIKKETDDIADLED